MNFTEKKPVIVVLGPTASGKTSLSIEIAKRYNGEIISADSMQIYKYMDIGTAKPDEEEKEGIVHHMIDVVLPSDSYSVYDYVKEAKEKISSCHKRNVLPVVAGGTGLYINHLIYNIKLSESSGDEKIRESLLKRQEEEGIEVLYEELIKIDPISAEKIHINNTKRVIRALEVYYSTGKTMAEQNENSRKEDPEYNYIMLMPNHEREVLYERINERVDVMIKKGLEEEVRGLLNMGYDKSLNSMQAIGYKEMFSYIDGEDTLDSAIEKIKQNTRRYAKRQLTWFRGNVEKKILTGDIKEEGLREAEKFLKNC